MDWMCTKYYIFDDVQEKNDKLLDIIDLYRINFLAYHCWYICDCWYVFVFKIFSHHRNDICPIIF